MKIKENAMTIKRHSEAEPKNPRKVQHNDWILHFAFAPFRMTIPAQALALILTFGAIGEAQAECSAQTASWTSQCYNKWEPGKVNNCGDGCTYDYANGKLTVTATKAGASVPQGMFCDSYYESGLFPTITDIEIAGEFKTIGRHAFLNSGVTISGKDGVLYTNNLYENPFGNGNILTGTIIVSDNQTSLLQGPWYNSVLDATVILPSTINSINAWAIYGLNLGENAKIYCGAENCEELFRSVSCNGVPEQYRTKCQEHLNTLLSSGRLLSYPDGCAKMGASGCTKCKNENFRLNDGECDRLRYTPAEATQWLKDDDNTVILTFKK